MVYEIRVSADMIRANCLFSAVGWKEWGRKKDRKRLFPTTPPASSLKRGFARIISGFARLSSTMGLMPVTSTFAFHLFWAPALSFRLLQLLLDLVDDILQVDLAGGGEDPESQHCVLAQVGPSDQVEVLALDLGEEKMKTCQDWRKKA